MEDGEGTASPQEQLAAEVASDKSQEGTVTSDDVADVLHLRKTENKGDGDEGKDGEGSDDAEEDGAGDGSDAGDGDGADGDEEEIDEEVDEGDDEPEVVNADDQQFTLTVKDANGKEYTISTDDDIEEILEDFEPKSNGQIFKILQDLQKLQTAKDQHEADQEKQQNDAVYQEKVKSIRGNWDKEIAALQGDKRIPVTADGKVPARVTEVFKFIQSENDKRVKDGRPLLESFEDALDKLELRESKDEGAKKAKEEKELARKRGAVVGGSSAAATSTTSNYRRGARTATAALKQMGVL